MKLKLNKKTMIIAGAAVLAAALIAVVAIIISTTRKKVPENVQEPTTATDLMVVDITDADGKSYKLEGVGVTDESGKTVITVTDENGNKTVITGNVSVGADGRKTVTGATVTEGGKLVTSEGVSISTEGATVGEIKDNNRGETATDIVVSSDKVKDVLDKQEQASMEAASRAEAESRQQADKPSSDPETREPAKEPETQAPAIEPETEETTKAPAGGNTTEPKPEPKPEPTEPTTKAPEQSAEQEFLANSELGEYDTYVKVYNYKGTRTNLTVPSHINGKPVTSVSIRNNGSITKVTIPDTATACKLYSCGSLEVVNMGKGMSTINSYAITDCKSIREINIAADKVVLMDGWCTTNTVYNPYFKDAVLNFTTSPDRVKVKTSSSREVYSTASDDVAGFVTIVSFDYLTSDTSEQEQSKGMFGRVNFNVK